MKKYFVTGLVILLPLALTLAVVGFVFNFLTDPFVGIVQSILDYLGLLEKNFFFLSAAQVQVAVSKIIILVLLFFFTVFLGFLGHWFFGHYLLKVWDHIIHRIPVVRSIYKTCQDIIQTLFTSKANAFKQVVLIPFPQAHTYSIGMITNENVSDMLPNEPLVAVFVPTTPNPTSGFLILYKRKDLIYLDMKVEEAFKFVISCGVIVSPFKPMTQEEVQKLTNLSTP